LLRELRRAARVYRDRDGANGLDCDIAVDPLDAVLRDHDYGVAGLDARIDESGSDGKHPSLHVRPGRYVPRGFCRPVMHERPIAKAGRLAEEDTYCGAIGDRVGVDRVGRDGSPDGVGRRYLTAFMERVSVPDGTLTVTRSPFFLPTSARPTGES